MEHTIAKHIFEKFSGKFGNFEKRWKDFRKLEILRKGGHYHWYGAHTMGSILWATLANYVKPFGQKKFGKS